MGQNRVGTLGTAPFRINNTDTPQPASFPNEHYGGYHTYDFWNDGTEFSVCGIRRHHRAWNMLSYAADKGITYKLIKGYKTLDIMDNANWKVWRIESEEQAINKGGLSLWQVEVKPYANEDFVVHDSKIWQSTIEDNNFTPGEIDPLTSEPVSAWRESSIDSLAHKRNKDEGGVRAGNVYISFQEIYDLILQRVTKTQIDSNIALGESDTLIASQKAVKSYVDNLLNNALKSPKAFDASTATTFPVGVKGDTYRVTLGGEVQGVKLQAGDLFFTDKAAGAIAADWFVVQSNVDQATTEVLGLLRIATNAETIAEAVNDKAIVPSALGAWWQNVLSRAGLYFSQVVSFFGINLGTDATAGNVRNIAAKGSENSVSLRLDVKGNGTVGSNALAHAGTDTLVAATIEGNFKDTGINAANIVQSIALGETLFVSKNGDNAKALPGRLDRPYKTIQGAIDSIVYQIGVYVRIEVLEGTYDEAISFSGKLIFFVLHPHVIITSNHATATIQAELGAGNFYIMGFGKYSLARIKNTGSGNAIKTTISNAATYATYVAGITELSSALGATTYTASRGGLVLDSLQSVFSTGNKAIHGDFQNNPLYASNVDNIYSLADNAICTTTYQLIRCGKVYSTANTAIAVIYPDGGISKIFDCEEIYSLTTSAIKPLHRPMALQIQRTKVRGKGLVLQLGTNNCLVNEVYVICESTASSDTAIDFGNNFEGNDAKGKLTNLRLIMGNAAAVPIKSYGGAAYTFECNRIVFNTDTLYDPTKFTNLLAFELYNNIALVS